MSEHVTLDVYFDFACPYVNSVATWLQEVKRQLGEERIKVNWKFFPLEQVNAPADAEFSIWDLPPDRRSHGRDSMQAAVAARRQGSYSFDRFHVALLALKHDEGLDHGKRSTLEEAATRAGLDLEQFRIDLDNRDLLREIADDYQAGREGHGVFGTPTFVFSNGDSAYLRLLPPPPKEEAVSFWEEFVHDVCDRPYLREIKRPQPPQ